MKIVPINVELLNTDCHNYTRKSYELIEEAGRTCYKSANKNDCLDLTKSFIRGLIKSEHTSVLEHLTVSARIVCDRGTSHQLVRHRHIAVSQQSTRYVSSEDLEVIKPLSLNPTNPEYVEWLSSIQEDETNYNKLLELGASKDIARSVLPLCTKTELVISANVREWRHIIEQRSSKHAHENIREVARLLLNEFMKVLPVLFEDLELESTDK